jgi:hypothetical protein
MKRILAMTALLLSLAGTTAATAQTYQDYMRAQRGHGCVSDEGYGRFSRCDSGGG